MSKPGVARLLVLLALTLPIMTIGTVGCEVGNDTGPDKIATVAGISIFGLGFETTYPYALYVTLKPATLARADVTYAVDLYEKGNLRRSGVVVWSQLELDLRMAKTVDFPLSQAEHSAYASEGDLRQIFSVRVYE